MDETQLTAMEKMFMKLFFITTLALIAMALAGCGEGAHSAKGFRLPDGDVAKGKIAFRELLCHTCHIVSGEAGIPAPAQTIKAPVTLGGQVVKVKTYGELVTAIIHPSHNLSPQLEKEWMSDAKLSPMGSFNHLMTVEQLIDLVAFLQPHYRLIEREFYHQ